MSAPETSSRDLTVKRTFKLSKLLTRWEAILIYILILINVALMIFKPGTYFASGTIQSIIRSGMDLSIMVLGMMFILMLGDIDVSCAATMICSCMTMGLVFNSAFFTGIFSNEIIRSIVAVVCGIIVGALLGAFNGTLVARFKMPAVIVTIATSMLFRGAAKIILNGESIKVFPSWFKALGWTDIGGIIPVSMIVFLVFAVIFAIILHKTKFGRELYIIGNSMTVAQYSGIKVKRNKILVFVIMGITAAITGVFYAGRLGGISSAMGTGYEMDVIAIAALGGISTNGGKGKAYGPIIATFVMAFLKKSLDLMEVHANVQKIIVGIILIIAVMIPMFNKQFFDDLKFKWIYKGDRNIEAKNRNARKEVQQLKEEIAVVYADNSLSSAERNAKVAEIKNRITEIEYTCKTETKAALEELKRSRKAKA